ncbi:hypothetical protein KPL39_15915 [Clostridium gasigenes]|uniref:hypothetical protein n=1 Tax=Clostridium gasigenes TaxID=94869 RepID=UPI001C0D9539|nr:hypothetical protein [Clostridium gasigenes]MBU3137748.1 hypothetical protein [Clostridium gasigenes]
MKNKYIYLVFSNTGTLLSKCINNITKDDYVHVSLSFDDTFSKMYSFGRVFTSNPIIGGLVEENLHGGVYKKFTNTKCLIYKIYITEEQYKLLVDELKLFFSEKRKYRYNFIGLIAMQLDKTLIRDNYYFCSEFISQLLINSGIYETDKTPQFIKPSDLMKIENKEFIYEGLASNYTVYSDNDYSVVS